MKNKQTKQLLLLLISGLGLGALLSGFAGEGVWASLVNFGQWLRRLSDGGSVGNLAAWAITFLLTAIPFLGLLYKREDRQPLLLLLTTADFFLLAYFFLLYKISDLTETHIAPLPLLVLAVLTVWLCFRWRSHNKVDCLLPLMSLGIFFTVFFLVNPTLLSRQLLWMGKDSLARSWAMVCLGATLSTAITWALLRLLEQTKEQPASGLPGLLRIAGFSVAFLVGFTAITEILAEIRSLVSGNSDSTAIWQSSLLSAVVIGLRGIPGFLSALALLWGRDLALGIEQDPFDEETVLLAQEIAVRCKKALKLSILLSLCGNVLQLIFFSRILHIQVLLSLPIFPLALCGILFLLCGYFRKARELHDENAGFI